MSGTFKRTVQINRPVADVFAWHERPGALQRLTPPWEQVELIKPSSGVTDGQRVELRSKVGPVWTTWVVEHFDYQAGVQFCDRLIQGPFAHWEHFHRFADDGDGGCLLTDEIHYALPGGAVGGVAAGTVERRLEQMFAYRHAVTKADLELPPINPGRLLVSGASGLIGQAVVAFMRTQGWQVDRLVRRRVQADDEISWSPEAGAISWPEEYACDAVLHLAGANIAEGRWTPDRKKELRESRVHGTRTLVAALRQLKALPRVLLSGSAIGIYGNRGDETLDENSSPGGGFLADLCLEWENEIHALQTADIRLVMLRTGIVLSPAGGALAKLAPIFKAGMGGPLGDGRFWQSWISLDDWLRAMRHLLVDAAVSGPVNLVAPEAVRQRELAHTLCDVLGRPTFIPTPKLAVRAMFGQMADEALLASTRVLPSKLVASDFEFLHPSLENALRHVLGRA